MLKTLLIFSLIILNLNFIPILTSNAEEKIIFSKEQKIILRKDWGAKDPIKPMILQKPTKITIHHSGVIYPVKLNLKEKMKSLQKYSQSAEKMANGKIKEIWADIPYHFVISGTGEIAEGREIQYAGDTNTEYDPQNHILINVLGNFEEQKPTKEQITALTKLCDFLCKKYNISINEINGHNHYAITDCPGKNLNVLIPSLKEALSSQN